MTLSLSELLLKLKHQDSFFPLLGNDFVQRDFCSINLSIYSPIIDLKAVQTYDGLDKFIKSNLQSNHAKVSVGGYLEKRALYRPSTNFKNDAEERDIHLGVDFWSDALTPIYAPLDGIIHSFQYNDAHLDYGATIILQHQLEDSVFYTLYGHLTLASINNLKKGMSIKKGIPFTAMGKHHENGGWVPHLHFQVIKDLLGKEGDFPGVASEKEIDFYSNNCPDPNIITNNMTGSSMI